MLSSRFCRATIWCRGFTINCRTVKENENERRNPDRPGRSFRADTRRLHWYRRRRGPRSEAVRLPEAKRVRSVVAAHPVYTSEQDDMTPSPIHLADDVFFCFSDNRIIFLDLRKNRYLCLNERNTEAAKALLSDSTKAVPAPSSPSSILSEADTQRVADALNEGDLLAGNDWTGNETTAVYAQTPTTSLRVDGKAPKAVKLRHWTTFFYSAIWASAKLRWYSMKRTVQIAQSWKERLPKPQKGDRESLHDLVRVFLHLRPYYPREYLCLYDSLALAEFLSHYHFHPQWVFGVTAEPFSAHCWVQEGDCVLNDSVDFVSRFTPIMVV